MTGYALGLKLNKDNYLRTTTDVYPQAGMKVCSAKDGPRSTVGQTLSTKEIEWTDGENLWVYPNSVSEVLNIQSDQVFEFIIYNELEQKNKLRKNEESTSFLSRV